MMAIITEKPDSHYKTPNGGTSQATRYNDAHYTGSQGDPTFHAQSTPMNIEGISGDGESTVQGFDQCSATTGRGDIKK